MKTQSVLSRCAILPELAQVRFVAASAHCPIATVGATARQALTKLFNRSHSASSQGLNRQGPSK